LGCLPTITDALDVCQAHSTERLRWHMPDQGRFYAVNSVAEYRIVRIEDARYEQEEEPVTFGEEDYLLVWPTRPQVPMLLPFSQDKTALEETTLPSE